MTEKYFFASRLQGKCDWQGVCSDVFYQSFSVSQAERGKCSGVHFTTTKLHFRLRRGHASARSSRFSWLQWNSPHRFQWSWCHQVSKAHFCTLCKCSQKSFFLGSAASWSGLLKSRLCCRPGPRHCRLPTPMLHCRLERPKHTDTHFSTALPAYESRSLDVDKRPCWKNQLNSTNH